MGKTPAVKLNRICVYCGSSPGGDPEYAQAAESLGTLLADSGIGLVYGGGNVGLMHLVAEAALAKKGEVIGVIPHSLEQKELAHRGLTELLVVKSMHERKQKMADLADAFIALPGGIGTLEEIIEVFTWLQLDFHEKPIGLLNVCGFYDQLLEFLHHMVKQKFLKDEQLEMLQVSSDPIALLDKLQTFIPVKTAKWFDRRNET